MILTIENFDKFAENTEKNTPVYEIRNGRVYTHKIIFWDANRETLIMDKSDGIDKVYLICKWTMIPEQWTTTQQEAHTIAINQAAKYLLIANENYRNGKRLPQDLIESLQSFLNN